MVGKIAVQVFRIRFHIPAVLEAKFPFRYILKFIDAVWLDFPIVLQYTVPRDPWECSYMLGTSTDSIDFM